MFNLSWSKARNVISWDSPFSKQYAIQAGEWSEWKRRSISGMNRVRCFCRDGGEMSNDWNLKPTPFIFFSFPVIASFCVSPGFPRCSMVYFFSLVSTQNREHTSHRCFKRVGMLIGHAFDALKRQPGMKIEWRAGVCCSPLAFESSECECLDDFLFSIAQWPPDHTCPH